MKEGHKLKHRVVRLRMGFNLDLVPAAGLLTYFQSLHGLC